MNIKKVTEKGDRLLLYTTISKTSPSPFQGSVWNWSLTISQLAIFFEGRLDKYLKV